MFVFGDWSRPNRRLFGSRHPRAGAQPPGIVTVYKWHSDERSRRSVAKLAAMPTKGRSDFSLWSRKRLNSYKEALLAKLDRPIAVLKISKLGLEVPVFEGTDDLTLNRGAGRIVGTAKPGEPGNIGIAAHRDGFFRCLKGIHVGDQIQLASPTQGVTLQGRKRRNRETGRCSCSAVPRSFFANASDLLSILFRWRRTRTLHRPRSRCRT